jgi:hypothetical protein
MGPKKHRNGDVQWFIFMIFDGFTMVYHISLPQKLMNMVDAPVELRETPFSETQKEVPSTWDTWSARL